MMRDFAKWLDENVDKDPRMAGDHGSTTIILNKSQWEAKLEEAKARRKIVVVDFFASWCGPCRIMGPIFIELSKKYESNLIFCKVDVDEVADVTTEWEIRAMPTFLFINNGKQIDKVVGANKDELEKKIHHYATNQSGLGC
ncbi:hypothetical protein KC19_3G095300 [Ceratodon purpureus]|uniref:Thioredoxin domain-containing protein n=2 Tax=Ceratodon purpureus TaxID=3225 RepID=A0A8T0IGL6_CERPU|nr:hypothetical protein KC19_3G095300 [Ceratodon purpureus]